MTRPSSDSPTIPPAASRAGAAQVAPNAACPLGASRHGRFSHTPCARQRLPAGDGMGAVAARNVQICAGIGASAPPPRILSP